MASVLSSRPPTTLGQYDLLEEIGRGGMGSVYRAHDRRTGGTVAVKLLADKVAANPKLLSRFEREFRAVTKLDHPNIVRALDFGRAGSLAYLVMEYVEGRSLGALIDQTGKLAEAPAVRIVTQVAQALHYAHRRSVIHRDVKPDNVLVRPDGMAKLADFGLAKDPEDGHDLTRPATGLGTPHFMAPEQYEDAKSAGIPCDVYSLGCTLYNAVTGKVPFDSCTTLIALTRKIKGDTLSPRQLVPALSEQVDEAIRRALHPDPARRPASCLKFVKMLAPRTQPARPATSPPPAERRVSLRHLSTQPATCTIDIGALAGNSEMQEDWPAVVQDISTTGIGVILARRFEAGTVFAVELEGKSGAALPSRPVRVVRVRADHLGHWLHGCTFLTPLTDGECQHLL
jgi:serine/threonine protein kinase